METEQTIINQYLDYLNTKEFPCIAAKAALAKNQIRCMVAHHMACPEDDQRILEFLYTFVDDYRSSKKSFQSAAIIFKEPVIQNEMMFDGLLWQRLNALSFLDKQKYAHDKRVDDDPASKSFSFSLKEEAFFIIGLHPASSRRARQFRYPALVFNPHAEFEKLRRANRYEQMKRVVRKRDIAYSGSVNPMLKDFGEDSETFQYSGIRYTADWKCPLNSHHEETKHNSTP